MLGIGDRFPEFSLTALVPGELSAARRQDTGRLLHHDRLSRPTRASGRSCSSGPRTSPSCARPRSPSSGGSTASSPTVTRRCSGLRSTTSSCITPGVSSTQTSEPSFPDAVRLNRELASALGVLNDDGVAERATFIVDPDEDHPVRHGDRRDQSAATSKRCCGYSTLCRPTSCAPATGTRVRRRSTRRRS